MGESTVSLQTRKSLGSFSAKSMIMKETPMWKVVKLHISKTALILCNSAPHVCVLLYIVIGQLCTLMMRIIYKRLMCVLASKDKLYSVFKLLLFTFMNSYVIRPLYCVTLDAHMPCWC